MAIVEVHILPKTRKLIINASSQELANKLLRELEKLGIKIVNIEARDVRCG